MQDLQHITPNTKVAARCLIVLGQKQLFCQTKGTGHRYFLILLSYGYITMQTWLKIIAWTTPKRTRVAKTTVPQISEEGESAVLPTLHNRRG